MTVGILAVISVGWLVWHVARPQEPVYKGRRLSQWLDDYNRDAEDGNNTAVISSAIRAMGTNCLPFLLADLEYSESPLRVNARRFLARQKWVKLPVNERYPYYDPAIMALSELGTNAAALCPEFLEMSDDPKKWWTAVISLLAIGPPSIPTLSKICHSTNSIEREVAVFMIAKLKSEPGPWVARSWLGGSIQRKRILTVSYTATEDDIPELVKLLESPDAAVRRAAAEAIPIYTRSNFTTPVFMATEALLKALKDPDPNVRIAAREALKMTDPPAAAQAGIQ